MNDLPGQRLLWLRPHRLLGYAAVCAGLAGGAVAWDMPVIRAVTQIDTGGDIPRVIDYSEVFGHGVGVALIITTAAVLDNRGWLCFLTLSLYAYGAGILADVMKIVHFRHRPSHLIDLDCAVNDTFIGWFPWWTHGMPIEHVVTSLPSAHAATAVGLAIGLSRLYPRGRYLFAVFAALAGLQRVMSLSHFPSDVFAGAALGCLLAWLLSQPWSMASRWLDGAPQDRVPPSEPTVQTAGRSRCA